MWGDVGRCGEVKAASSHRSASAPPHARRSPRPPPVSAATRWVRWGGYHGTTELDSTEASCTVAHHTAVE
jgi:hypothetical protein